MRVGAFLPTGQVAQVKAALNTHDELCIAESWETLENLVRLRPLSVVVFNPAADGRLDLTTACNLIRKYASVPFVAYIPLEATFVRGVAQMSNQGLQDVVVTHSNDSALRFRETLNRVSAVEEVSALVDRLEPPLRRLPRSLGRILVDSLHHPHRYASAADIALSANITLSGLYRSFRSAGLTSPKSFVVGARVFRGYLYLRDTAFSVRDVAVKLGYTHQRIFAHQIECVFGAPPSILRHALSAEQSIVRALAWFGGT